MKPRDQLNESQLRSVVASMRPEWGPSHYESVRTRIEGEVKRRRRRRTAFASMTGLALVFCASLALREMLTKNGIAPTNVAANKALVPATPADIPKQAIPQASREDPSRVEIVSLEPQTTVQPEVEQDRQSFTLVQGGARFKVRAPQNTIVTPRPVEVHVLDLRIQDIGTTFDVRLMADQSVKVDVHEGLVLVTGPDISKYVPAGQSVVFYEKKPANNTLKNVAAAAAVNHAPIEDPSSEPQPIVAESSATAHPSEPPEVQALLAAADQARRSGRLDEALVSIRAFIARCSHPTSCSFGHFSEGKILQVLGRSEEASTSFEAVGQGPFAETALVRAIEALEQAGLSERAQALTARYKQMYPEGTFRGRLKLE